MSNNDPEVPSSRWTCEACGCHTNTDTTNSVSCGVCGTRRVSSHHHGRLRRGLWAIGVPAENQYDDEEDIDMEDDDEVDSEMEHSDEDAMNGNRVSNLRRSGSDMLSVSDRLSVALNPARDFGRPQAAAQAHSIMDSNCLLAQAVSSGSHYQPKWSALHCSSSIEVEEISRQVACVTEVGNNCNCVRSSEAIPSSSALYSETSAESPVADAPSLIGWRIAFELPSREPGRNVAGSYLIGIVADEFCDFNSRNGLQQSRLFWGVEDNGRKYEGGTRGMAVILSSTIGGARSSESALFASKEVLTIVIDAEAGTLNMWRDSRFVGAVVSGLPKNRIFYPVAAAFSPGAVVAITGLTNCPSAIITEYLRAQQEIKDHKNDLCRNVLKQRRTTFLAEGQLSVELKAVLQIIWSWYCKTEGDALKSSISAIDASRLWYRSGLKFSRLCKLLDRKRMKEQGNNDASNTCAHNGTQGFQFDQKVAFIDFVEEVQNVVNEEEEKTTNSRNEEPLEPPMDSNSSNSHLSFRVGDKVGVVDGSNIYGDAFKGPLSPGDLGTVIDLQRGARDRYSVRVLFNGRKWWYQPQALVSERSGLVDPLAVRFLADLLRSHGFYSNLAPFWGKPVTAESWKVGDLVVALEKNEPAICGELSNESIVGAISEVSLLNRRGSGTVHVDYPTGGTKRVNVSSLVHTAFYHMHSVLKINDSFVPSSGGKPGRKVSKSSPHVSEEGCQALSENENDLNSNFLHSSALVNKNKLAPILMLDKDALKLLINECKRKSSLARLFSAGLSDAILSGIELTRNDGVDVSSVASLGALCVAVCQQLFSTAAEEKRSFESDASASDSIPDESDVPDDNNAFDSIFSTSGSLRSVRNTLNSRHGQFIASSAVDLRELVQDLGFGTEQRRSVLLALMASDRMQFEPRQFGRSAAGGSDEPFDRMRHSLSPFALLNPEALGLPMSASSHEDNVLSSLYGVPSNRSGSLGEQVSSAALRAQQHTQKRVITRKKSPSTKAFINNGLLLDNQEWVKKFVASGVGSKMKDDEGNSILLIAICLGCSCDVINVLVDTGFVVGHKEIQLAAYSDQPESLALILKQAVYSEGLVDVTRCSIAVVGVLEAAMQRQRQQEDDMRDIALQFGVSLLWKFVDLTLSFCIEGKDSYSNCCIEALVGDALFQAISQSQNETEGFADNHGPNDTVRAVVLNTVLISALDGKSGRKSNASIGSSLIEILPAEVIVSSLSNDEALSSYLRLMEIHLWNKCINQAVVGLVLAECLLRKCPSLRASFFKYGLRELCNAHLNIAEEALHSIQQSSPEPESFTQNPVVCCPKGHVTALHLTRHSSFKCDLCSKGLEQGKPMYGCRECDWDACEMCTDKAEGGITKWNFVKNLAQVCLEMIPAPSAEDVSGFDEIHRIVDGIKRRDPVSIRALGMLLDIPGKITLFEFTTLVLPALHFSLVSSFERGECKNPKEELVGTGHRKKKLRVSSLRSHSTRGASFYTQDKSRRFTHPETDPFISALMMLVSSSGSKVPSLPLSTVSQVESSGNEEKEEQPEDNVLRRDSNSSKPLLTSRKLVPQLLYMLHASLAFNERLIVTRHTPLESEGELQSLLSTIEVELISLQECVRDTLPQAGTKRVLCCQLQKNTVCAELLLPILELQQQIIRSRGIWIPSYLKYCRQLVQDCAIVADMGSSTGYKSSPKSCSWRVAQVVGYDEVTCAHVVRYASRRTNTSAPPTGSYVPDDGDGDYILERNSCFITDDLRFDGREAKLILAARDYCILKRLKQARSVPAAVERDPGCLALNCRTGDDFTDVELATMLLLGTRVECDIKSPDGYNMYTIVSVLMKNRLCKEKKLTHLDKNLTASDDMVSYSAVSDGGEILDNLFGRNIRNYDSMIIERGREYKRKHALRNDSSGTPSSNVPVIRGINSLNQRGSPGIFNADYGTLKRTWSALSAVQNMRPLELCGNRDGLNEDDIERRSLVNYDTVEHPPVIIVEFCHQDALSTVSVRHAARATLFSTLNRLFRKNANRTNKFLREKRCTLTYSLDIQWSYDYGKGEQVSPSVEPVLSTVEPWIKRRWIESAMTDTEELHYAGSSTDSELNACVHESWYSLEDGVSTRGAGCTKVYSALDNCEGLNAVSVQCLKVINILAELYLVSRIDCLMTPSNQKKIYPLSTSPSSSRETYDKNNGERSKSSLFVSEALTKKLLDQLEDPLSVVSGALPDWCSIAPTFASFAFSHASRRLLLDRAAFGVSRAVFCQQETKVNVGPLRQRMASLRARAVELVTEAFSRDADDPTALQLQADELYGMEEALNSRVAAQFRAQGWTEHALESAKAAIRRDHLLSDASSVMARYACEASLNRRRLEVRFEGESGFDAASGDEAGVTRGFYADVAEALLSCDHVAGVYCPTACPSITQLVDDHSSGRDPFRSSQKLPLWIPDVDPSHTVIIPTPRSLADPSSSLGVFPRPLGHNHPMRAAVLKEFRFMGRLFAAALRDRFIFPLPLSISFLKLVQSSSFTEDSMLSGVIASLCQYSINTSSSSMTPDQNSCTSSAQASSESSPVIQGNSGDVSCLYQNHPSLRTPKATNWCLESLDLPRPGFLGGEIYAVEHYICAALDNLEETEPNLTKDELRQRRQEIASDKSFARKALGKSYDCTFEEYFEDRTFVDPLDPLQGQDACQLCPNGAQVPVTIDNVRAWVTLAKQFVLHDGVIAQADAFRQGVNDFFCVDALLLLTPRELYEDVCGGGDNVDSWDEDAIRSLLKLDGGKGAAEALVAVAALGGDGGAALSRRFGPSSPTISYLTKSLLEATSIQRRQFLSFVTSVPIVTPGKIEVVPVVSPSGEFLPMRDPGCMPRANTCARRLYLPKFESYALFKQVFYSVLKEESRFKGFYEWRG